MILFPPLALGAILPGSAGRREESRRGTHECVRHAASAIKSLVRSGLSDAEVYQLIIPRRTLAHRVAKRQSLSKEESDKAVRVARITAYAEQVFGESERAWRWLRKPKHQFDGRTPIEMLATEAGARLVEEMIVQIDDSMAA